MIDPRGTFELLADRLQLTDVDRMRPVLSRPSQSSRRSTELDSSGHRSRPGCRLRQPLADQSRRRRRDPLQPAARSVRHRSRPAASALTGPGRLEDGRCAIGRERSSTPGNGVRARPVSMPAPNTICLTPLAQPARPRTAPVTVLTRPRRICQTPLATRRTYLPRSRDTDSQRQTQRLTTAVLAPQDPLEVDPCLGDRLVHDTAIAPHRHAAGLAELGEQVGVLPARQPEGGVERLGPVGKDRRTDDHRRGRGVSDPLLVDVPPTLEEPAVDHPLRGVAIEDRQDRAGDDVGAGRVERGHELDEPRTVRPLVVVDEADRVGVPCAGGCDGGIAGLRDTSCRLCT